MMKRLFFLISCALLGTANSKPINKGPLIRHAVQQTVDLLHCLTTANSKDDYQQSRGEPKGARSHLQEFALVGKDDYKQLEGELRAAYSRLRPSKSCEELELTAVGYIHLNNLRTLAKGWLKYKTEKEEHILPLMIQQYGVLNLSSNDSTETWTRLLRDALMKRGVNQHADWETQWREMGDKWTNWLLHIASEELYIDKKILSARRFGIGFPTEEQFTYGVRETMNLLNCVNEATPFSNDGTTSKEPIISRAKVVLSKLQAAHPSIKPQTTCKAFRLKVTQDVMNRVEKLCSLGESWVGDRAKVDFASLVLKRNNLLFSALHAVMLKEYYDMDGHENGFLGLLVAAFNLHKYDQSIRKSQTKTIQGRWLEISKSLILKPEDTDGSSINAQRSSINAQRSSINAQRSSINAQGSSINAQRKQDAGRTRGKGNRGKGKGKMNGRKQRAFPSV